MAKQITFRHFTIRQLVLELNKCARLNKWRNTVPILAYTIITTSGEKISDRVVYEGSFVIREIIERYGGLFGVKQFVIRQVRSIPQNRILVSDQSAHQYRLCKGTIWNLLFAKVAESV